MRTFIICSALLFAFFAGHCQNAQDTISIVKKGRFHKNGEFLNVNQLLNLMRHNPEAYERMRKAKANSIFASSLSFVGGALIGWPIGQSIAGGEANWGMAGVGAGLIVVSIPLINSYKNNSTMAVEIYNEGLLRNTRRDVELLFQSDGRTVGLLLRF